MAPVIHEGSYYHGFAKLIQYNIASKYLFLYEKQKLLLTIVRKVLFAEDRSECRDVQQHKIMEESERQVFSHELRHLYHPVNVLGTLCKTGQTLRVCRL